MGIVLDKLCAEIRFRCLSSILKHAADGVILGAMAVPLLLHTTASLPLKSRKKSLVTEDTLSCSYSTSSSLYARCRPHRNLAWNQRILVVAISRRVSKLRKAARSLERLGFGNVAIGRTRYEHDGCAREGVYRAQVALQEKDGVQSEEARSAAMETLDLLEWPRVCRAVASFAATSLAKDQLQVLEIPATREASEVLLELTSAGVELISLLGGPFELGALRTEVV